MPPSPSKGKNIAKVSGKFFRHKDRNNGSSSSSSYSGNGGNSSNGSSNSYSQTATIRKDETLELQDLPLTLPQLTPLDNTRSLPRYQALVSGELASMEELDGLQLEIELLLSSVIVRQMALNNQIAVIEQLERGKLPPRQAASPGKRLRIGEPNRTAKKTKDTTGKAKETNQTLAPPPGSKPPKVKCSIVMNEPLFDVPDLGAPETPKPPPPKNDITNRFWALVDQYCQEITVDDIKVLEDLISAQSDESDYYKIPQLGRHYTLRWAQEDLTDEQKEGMKIVDVKKKIKTELKTELSDKLLKEVDLNGCEDDVPPMGPLTQRVIAGLVEENVLVPENIDTKVDGIGLSRPAMMRNLNIANAASLEKRIKKELQEQGVMDADSCLEEDDDEILSEMKRCQEQLKSISAYNRCQLKRLQTKAREALVRHDLKKKLKDAEAKVLESYRSITAARQKKKVPCKKDKEMAWKAIKEREAIIRNLDISTSSLY